MIDNYDSFTYNLVQYLGELGREVLVYRNDQISCEEIARLAPEQIIISPGPCSPNEAGISPAVVARFAGVIPILGVCLGHQTIGQVFGGKVVRSKRLMHGKLSPIHHRGGGTLFREIPSPFNATRYHSLIIERESLPDCLELTAWTETGEVMGIRHRQYAVEGIQFHPESILTEYGRQMLQNFLMRNCVPAAASSEE